MATRDRSFEAKLGTILLLGTLVLPLGLFIAAFPHDWNRAVTLWSAVLVTITMLNATFYYFYSVLNYE